jgi:exodeoxyribonuclease-3
MKIATWNVNSIRQRLDHLAGWLARAAPDVVCVQETKVEDARFPEEPIAEAGYKSVVFGQKTYNGVAILARHGLAIEDVQKNLASDEEDAQRRLIAATIEGIRIINVYVPNGQAVGTPAFAFKLEWLGRLRAEIAKRHSPADSVLLCGDFNVAPEPIDVHDPKRWEGSVLFHPDERAALKRIVDWGFVDGFRKHHAEPKMFSWWDYRMGAYKRNWGLRIDHVLLTLPLAARTKDVWIDKAPRELERPSDHAPVVVELSDEG